MELRRIAARLKGRHIDERQSPEAARWWRKLDQRGSPSRDAGPTAAAAAPIHGLKRSLDMSIYRDSGSARNVSLIKGCASSRPETYGHIVTTLIDYAGRRKSQELLGRTRRTLDRLLSVQFLDGRFQRENANACSRLPISFNSGEIRLGLAAGVRSFGDDYRATVIPPAAWLRDTPGIETLMSDGIPAILQRQGHHGGVLARARELRRRGKC